MYSMKKQNLTDVAELPTCMYSMKSFHDSQEGGLQELLMRQEKVLQKLGTIQAELDLLSASQNEKTSAAPTVQTGGKKIPPANFTGGLPKPVFKKPGPLPKDLVIYCNPTCQPRALLTLISQLENKYKVLLIEYKHSTASNCSPVLNLSLSGFVNNIRGESRLNTQMIVSWIWRNDVDGVEMMTSPIKHTNVAGESNLCRYISRLLGIYNHEPIAATLSDLWLDRASLITAPAAATKEKDAVMGQLSQTFKSGNSYILGSECSIADMVLVSALTCGGSTKAAAIKQQAVSKWITDVQKQLVSC